MRAKDLAKLMPILGILLLLHSCATTYQPQGATGGYSDFQLNTYVYQVNFAGNGYTSAIETQRYAYIRAAEIAYENNCKYFTILSRDGNTETSYAQWGNYNSTVTQDMFGNYSVRTTTPQTVQINKHTTQLIIGLIPNHIDINSIRSPVFSVENIFQSMRYDPIKKKLLD